ELDVGNLLEAVDEESRDDQQQERKGHLADDQYLADRKTPGVVAADAAARIRFQRSVEIHASRANRGRQAEENSGEQRDAESEGKNSCVGREVKRHVTAAAGDETDEHGIGPLREEQPHGSAGEGQKRALREELAEETRAPGSQRNAHDDLFFARSGTGQKKIRYIGACDQKDESDEAHQEEQRSG